MPNSEDDDIIVKTEGLNIGEMWKYLHIVNEKKIWCNDVYCNICNISAATDHLRSPSSRLVVGRIGMEGAGSLKELL